MGKIKAMECLMKHGAQVDMNDKVSDESQLTLWLMHD